jgi:hypothetical protein
MSAGRSTEVTAEKGFGTGLRAQLALRRPTEESPDAELLALLESDLGERGSDWWAKQLEQSGDKKVPVKESASGRLRAIK